MNAQSSAKSQRIQPQRRARRKRAVTRRMRRFEGALAQLPVVQVQWRNVLQGVEAPPALQATPWHYSKILSLLLLVAALVSVGMLHTQDQWFLYEEDVRFLDLERLESGALYPRADVDGWSIFWLQPQVVRERLLEHSWVAGAQVEMRLPAILDVSIQEREPVAVWTTNDGSYWLAANGAALPMSPQEASNLPATTLPQIVDPLRSAETLAPNRPLHMQAGILESALALMEALPELDGKVRYNQTVGLNFPLPDPQVWVYWGDGLDMQHKLENLAAASEMVRSGDSPAQILDIRFINRPYVR